MAVGFPALLRERVPAESGETALPDEATCFFHAGKRAVQTCGACGRFVCALCDLEIDGEHLCPTCLSEGRRLGALRKLEQNRVLFDSIALAFAVLPILIWPFTCLTAPASLYVVIRYWKSPPGVLPRTKIRFILAGLLALAQIAGWCVLARFALSNLGAQ
jgi:hypothetical protein